MHLNIGRLFFGFLYKKFETYLLNPEAQRYLKVPVPESKTKLATKHGYVKALTNVHLCAIPFSEYQTLEKDNGSKIALVELLKAKIVDNPRPLDVAPPATSTITAQTITLLV